MVLARVSEPPDWLNTTVAWFCIRSALTPVTVQAMCRPSGCEWCKLKSHDARCNRFDKGHSPRRVWPRCFARLEALPSGRDQAFRIGLTAKRIMTRPPAERPMRRGPWAGSALAGAPVAGRAAAAGAEAGSRAVAVGLSYVRPHWLGPGSPGRACAMIRPCRERWALA